VQARVPRGACWCFCIGVGIGGKDTEPPLNIKKVAQEVEKYHKKAGELDLEQDWAASACAELDMS
jgi:hypothetical protein